MTELRSTAQKLFTRPTVREKWTAELGGPVEFAPVGREVTLRETQTSSQKPGDQRVVRVGPEGEVEAVRTPEGRYVARGDEGVELSWTSSSKYVHDSMCPSVDNTHRELRLQGPNFTRTLDDCCTGNAQSARQWAPVVRDGRILVQTSDRVIECLDRDGNQVFTHEGNAWSQYGIAPAIGPDGRVVICDLKHNTLFSYRPDGTAAWERTFYKNIRCQPLPLADGTTLVAMQSDQNGVTSLKRLDDQGETLSEVMLPGSMVTGLSQAPDGTWLVATNDSPRLAGYDSAWQLRWEQPLAQASVGPAQVLEDGSLMIVGRHGHVTVLEVTDPRTAPELPAELQTQAGTVQEGPDYISVAGVRVRRK